MANFQLSEEGRVWRVSSARLTNQCKFNRPPWEQWKGWVKDGPENMQWTPNKVRKKKSIPITSTFRMLRQKDGKFRASLSYTDRTCLKNTNTKRKKQKTKTRKKEHFPQ